MNKTYIQKPINLKPTLDTYFYGTLREQIRQCREEMSDNLYVTVHASLNNKISVTLRDRLYYYLYNQVIEDLNDKL